MRFFLLILLFISNSIYAQNLSFTWINGSDSGNKAGNYGVRGKPSPLNSPGSRSLHTSWIDSNNNLWIFGGTGRDKDGIGGYLNDLWKYDIASNEWTWVGGSRISGRNAFNAPPNTDSVRGNYGTKGVPSITNYPGARIWAMGWTDTTGNLWLYGGEGYDKNNKSIHLGDLWRYNIQSGLWTWMSGSDSVNRLVPTTVVGNFGIKGVASPTNVPGARRGSVSWRDNKNNLWLWGGPGYGKTLESGVLNDLWKYDISNGLWTWMSGNDTVNSRGRYGTVGISNALNEPSARFRNANWQDTLGNFWIYGACCGSISGKSDLWKYDISNGLWTWLNGPDSIGNTLPIYGVKGIGEIKNIPGTRSGGVTWVDRKQNNLWFFGGNGVDKNGVNGQYNDLWKFDINKNIWTWVNGSDTMNQKGVYGLKGINNNSNYIGARGGATTNIDKNGNIWLFGGNDKNVLFNDLWKITICDSLVKPIFNNSKYSFCSNDSLNLSISNAKNGDSFKWYYGGNIDNSNVTSKVFKDSLKIYVVKSDIKGCSISSDTIQLVKIGAPAPPLASNMNTCVGATTTALNAVASSGNNLNWYGTNSTGGTSSNTAPIPSTSSVGSVNYYVSQISPLSGCESERSKITVNIYPIPAAPTISRDVNNFLVASTTGINWYINSDKLADTSQKFKPTTNGTYSATTTQNGCTSARSEGYYFLTTNAVDLNNGEYFNVSPNPTSGEVNISYKFSSNKEIFISVIDMNGKNIILNRKIKSVDKINLGANSAGSYIFQLRDKTGRLITTQKVIKE